MRMAAQDSGEQKQALRREMRSRRRALAAPEKALADVSICESLIARHDLGDSVAVFLATPDEVNIDPFIEAMMRNGVEIVAPRWNGETYELARLSGLAADSLRRGPMGIREPAKAEIVLPSEIHSWIVPGLAFTMGGKRLGYGGGWYDRFLAAASKDAVKIGVAYSCQIVADLPSELHDILLSDICMA